MNMSRTAVVLIVALLAIIALSVYLWFSVGTGSAEVDARMASTLQCFTCEKCGHSFTLTMEQITNMLRNQGLILCPKCGKGGARIDLAPQSSTTRPAASQPARHNAKLGGLPALPQSLDRGDHSQAPQADQELAAGPPAD